MNEYDEKHAHIMEVFPGTPPNQIEKDFAQGAMDLILGGYTGQPGINTGLNRAYLQVTPEGDTIEVLTVTVQYADFAARPVMILCTEGFNGLIHAATHTGEPTEESNVITPPTEEEVEDVTKARAAFAEDAIKADLDAALAEILGDPGAGAS